MSIGKHLVIKNSLYVRLNISEMRYTLQLYFFMLYGFFNYNYFTNYD
jgi:hypothetical protein